MTSSSRWLIRLWPVVLFQQSLLHLSRSSVSDNRNSEQSNIIRQGQNIKKFVSIRNEVPNDFKDNKNDAFDKMASQSQNIEKSALDELRVLGKQIIIDALRYDELDHLKTERASFEDEHEQTDFIKKKKTNTLMGEGENEGSYRDFFMCPPCQCSRRLWGRISQTIAANCSFAKLAELPTSLPEDVRFINMSFNLLHSFNISSLSKYHHLVVLNLNNNHLKNIYKEKSTVPFAPLRALTLNSNLINRLEDINLHLLPNLKVLDISNNQIKTITNSSFTNCKLIKVLYLSKNKITHIENKAFDDLSRLSVLYLDNNPDLGYGKNFKPRSFQNLQKLTKLEIQGNSRGIDSYPNELLGTLINLEQLTVDGLGGKAVLGPPLLNLRHLRELKFGPNAICNFKYLSSTFFQNLPYLESLHFYRCNFRGIDPVAFHYLPNLRSYSLQYMNAYDLDQAFQSLEGLQNSSLISLAFVRIYHTTPICRTLTYEHGKYIKYLELRVLDLRMNHLAFLSDDFLACIPKTLQVLKLGENKFTQRSPILTRLWFLKNLLQLDLTNQLIEFEDPTMTEQLNQPSDANNIYYKRNSVMEAKSQDKGLYQVKNCSCHCNVSDANHYLNESLNLSNFHENRQHSLTMSHSIHQIIRDEETKNSTENSNKFNMSLIPPNLLSIIAPQYPFFARILQFPSIKMMSVRFVNFSYNYMHDWGIGYLPPHVEKADFSHNQGDSLQNKFFQHNSHLKYLFLTHNNLGPVFADDKNGTIFDSLSRLKLLDISMNMIFTLPQNIFRGLSNLERLIIRDNKLQILDIKIGHMKYLNFIDLRKNSISWLSKTVRQDLDLIASGQKIVIDLTYNPLPCTCSGIEIWQWMANTKIFLNSQQYLTCFYGNGDSIYVENIHSIIRTLKKQCSPYPAFLVSSASGLCGLFVALFVITVVYRKRWRLLYTINNRFLVKLFGFRSAAAASGAKFKFDAYVVYAEDDRDFVLNNFLLEMESKRGHKLCVEDRDFLPGTFNFSNTNSAVQNSAVTVFVVSEDFISDREYHYPLQVALLEEYHNQV